MKHFYFVLFTTFYLLCPRNTCAENIKYAFFMPTNASNQSQKNTHYKKKLPTTIKKQQYSPNSSQQPITKTLKKHPLKKNKLTPEKIQKIKQYSLKNPPIKNSTDDDTIKVPFNKYMLINERLNKLPLIDESQPFFQQIYAHYATELRVLADTKRIPKNFKQKRTLAKTTSILPFEIK